MRTWIKRTLIAVFGLSVIAGSLAACGHRSHRGAFTQASAEDVANWRGKVIERAGKELVLDDAQKQRLGVLFDKINEQRLAFIGTQGDPRANLRQLIQGDKFDRARAGTLVTEKTDAVRGKSPEVINAMADFYDALNPTQQAKLREFMDKRQHGRRG